MNRFENLALWLLHHKFTLYSVKFKDERRYYASDDKHNINIEFGNSRLVYYNKITCENKSLLRSIKNIELFKQDLIDWGFAK